MAAKPLAVAEAVARKAEVLRAGEGPALLDIECYRYSGHSTTDTNAYRSRDEMKAWQAHDPITRFRDRLVDGGVITAGEADEMVEAASSLTLQEGSADKVAEAMMTTDRYAKAARSELPNGASLVGLVKGAGMIEPNMGTMLCFLVTDAAMERSTMQACLERCVKGTLGSVGVDGDESTSDMCVLLSSG